MKAEVEWITGVLRVGTRYQRYGDPYEFSCTVVKKGDKVELIGGVGTVTRSMWKAIRKTFFSDGITDAYWDRENTTVEVKK